MSSWTVILITPIWRPKSVTNRCVIELIDGFYGKVAFLIGPANLIPPLFPLFQCDNKYISVIQAH